MARFKLRPLFSRSKTAVSSTSNDSNLSSTTTAANPSPQDDPAVRQLDHTPSLDRLKDHFQNHDSDRAKSAPAAPRPQSQGRRSTPPSAGQRASIQSLSSVGEEKEDSEAQHDNRPSLMSQIRPALVLQEPTPPTSENPLAPNRALLPKSPLTQDDRPRSQGGLSLQETTITRHSSSASPKHVSRTHSIVDSANGPPHAVRPGNMPRKIWVRRPGASATLVQIKDDDLVDDVRDMILRKYANSLGRTFDAPDMTLRIFTRAETAHGRTDRVLGPEEDICRTLDLYYPGGQSVEEALTIDVPTRRTPKPSPRPHYGSYNPLEDYRPVESGTDYFPPMPPMQPVLPGAIVAHHSSAGQENPRAMAVLTTGQLPPLPSPGSTRKYHRPKFGRQHTSSPTIVQHNAAGMPVTLSHAPHRQSTRPRVDSSASESLHPNGTAAAAAPPPPPPPALPTPPAPEAAPTGRSSTPPTPANPSATLNPARAPRPRKPRKTTPTDKSLNRRRERRGSNESPANLGLSYMSSMLDGSVPPINVLLVEDNSINLRVLVGLMKRLRVRWESATNGQIAVDKWRKGGYHLILMDIQMPVMNGLQATKEIRRLEKVNGIGVFSGSTPSSPQEYRQLRTVSEDGEADETTEEEKRKSSDKLPLAEGIFKSPIIIVALTASSLQSDRHEALAAGCNDFLTKPVNMGWLERKVKEWGCMQALIDYDGWKQWREINDKEDAGKSEDQRTKERAGNEKQRQKLDRLSAVQQKGWADKAEREAAASAATAPASSEDS